MVSKGMKVAGQNNYAELSHCHVSGFTTNGEWNSLRSKGNIRPLPVFEVRSKARKKYSHTSVNAMIDMLTPVREFKVFLLGHGVSYCYFCQAL